MHVLCQQVHVAVYYYVPGFGCFFSVVRECLRLCSPFWCTILPALPPIHPLCCSCFQMPTYLYIKSAAFGYTPHAANASDAPVLACSATWCLFSHFDAACNSRSSLGEQHTLQRESPRLQRSLARNYLVTDCTAQSARWQQALICYGPLSLSCG